MSTQTAGQTTSHASLSYRIKRIYDFSAAQKKLRPTHAGVLSEMLESFDWTIPEHPNTRLEQHLQEMLDWKAVSAELKQEIREFLGRYLAVRNIA